MDNQLENQVETLEMDEQLQDTSNDEQEHIIEDTKVNIENSEKQRKSQELEKEISEKNDQEKRNSLFEKEKEKEEYQQQQEQIPVQKDNENLNIQEYLEKQLERYKKIEAQCFNQKDKVVLKRIMGTLESQVEKLKFNIIEPLTNDVSQFGGISLIKELEQTEESFFNNFKVEPHLKEIYKFYSKIFYVRGPSDDFSRINHESQTLTEGKFMVFCRQFGLIDEKVHHVRTQTKSCDTNRILVATAGTKTHQQIPKSTRNKPEQDFRILTFKELNNLFKKINGTQNEITFLKFIELLQELSKYMFQEIQNKAEIKLYKYLEVDSTQFRKKMQALSIPFNSKDQKGFRKPEGLQLQKSYNYSIDELKAKRLIVEEWKSQKKQELRDKLLYNGDQSRSKSIMFEPSYIKTSNYKERKLRKLGLYQNSRQIVNWENLDQLDPRLLIPEGFKPEDLIEDDEDAEDKFYLKSYDLSRKDNASQKQSSSAIQRSSASQLKTESTRRQIQNFSKIENLNILQRDSYLKLPKLQKK